MQKTYTGSCHCGAIRFTADIDLTLPTAKCNCSICAKTRTWSVILKPEAFQLLAGKDALIDYQFGAKHNYHPFCRHCGVRPFGHGHVEAIGGDYVAVQVMCLDDANLDDIIAAPIEYADGRNDNWWSPPAVTKHL